ncbi:MAG: penicillin-binding protein 1A [Gammaproteobacteria bacterium]|nr:penicillin-binding protein 1A [Gammaproteobacteria bacterium]
MSQLSSALRVVGFLVLLGALGTLLTGAGVYWYLNPKLPSIDVLKDVKLQVPLRVYTRDAKLIAEFGEKRRTPLALDQVPELMIQAVLASEDERFYEHPGVDWQGLTRAVIHLIRTGEKGPGGSTITMQVARNFFLGREKTYVRKLNEILLALKIERELSKGEILELYLNKIFLGHRAYGVGAAAQVYYGKPLAELELAQVAMIAGLPKAPSRFNPIVNPERAVARRNYVLGRMRELNFITQAQHDQAASAPVNASVHGLAVEVNAPYVAEMARVFMEKRLGDDAYTGGYKVFTTIDSRLQEAAKTALRNALMDYDLRHGYRGPELQLDPVSAREDLQKALSDIPGVGGLRPAAVFEVAEKSAKVLTKDAGEIEIPWEGLEWARSYRDENRTGAAPKKAADVVQVGDVVRVRRDPEKDVWHLVQIPAVEGALVSLDPNDGAVQALSGGFDFYRSKFNRVIQAERQPGSSFKPFIYSAALEYGFTPASLVNDAPVVFNDPGIEAVWRPENYSGKFFGPTRIREALYKSRNLVSIRLVRAIGVQQTVEHIERFGFDPARLPRNLSIALGSATVTPMELARGYAALANGGYLLDPYLILKAEDADGVVIMEARPLRICRECEKQPERATTVAVEQPSEGPIPDAFPISPESTEPEQEVDRLAPRVISPRNAWLMHSLMRDVIKRGTGRRALSLGRADLAGKTGTTNDQRDAWFSGFNPDIVTTVWVGFDQLEPLGRRETGARAALPMWIDYMRVALEGREEKYLEQPEGLVTVRIDPETGLLARANDENAIFETFYSERAPDSLAEATTPTAGTGQTKTQGVTEKLF